MDEEKRNWHPYDDLTPENYKVPKGEERFYHVVLETPLYDQTTGVRLSMPVLVKWNDKEGRKELEMAKFQKQLKVKILHDPNEWLKMMRQKVEAQKANSQPVTLSEKDAEIERLKRELEEARAANGQPEETKIGFKQQNADAGQLPEEPAENAEPVQPEQPEIAKGYEIEEHVMTPEEEAAENVTRKYKRKK